MAETQEQNKDEGPQQVMAHYRWKDTSVITRMMLERTPDGRYRCTLFARDDFPPESLAGIPEKLKIGGFDHVYADAHAGENVLVVNRLDDFRPLLNYLHEHDLTTGLPVVKNYDTQLAHQPGTLGQALSTIRGDTLKWSGRIGLAGHAAILADGLIKGDANMAWGALGALNPIILAVYGNGKAEIDFNSMMDKMCTYFRAQGIDIPNSAMDHDRQRGLLAGVNKLLSTYPVQIGHALGSIGAYNLIISGMREYNSGNRKAITRALAGATSLAGNGAIIFIPENKKAQEDEMSLGEQVSYGFTHAPQGAAFALRHPVQATGNIGEFIKDSPLRFNGLLNMSDNILWFVNAMGQFEMQRKHPVLNADTLPGKLKMVTPYLSMVTAISFAAATFLSTISSKNRDSAYLDENMFDPMFAAATKMLIHIPKEDREPTLLHMADFLAEQEELKDAGIDTDKVINEIRTRLQVMEQSPWFKLANDNRAATQQIARS